MTGGREAAWAGPQIAGFRGPVAGRPRDPPTRPSPGPERWPPRTASSSGRGAPSCRGGEPRTLRGVGIGPKVLQILVPESFRLGAPPRLEGWCQGSPGWSSCQSEEPGQLGRVVQTGVWGRGTSAGRCRGTRCEGQWSWASCHCQCGRGGPPADRFRLSTELLRGLQQHWVAACMRVGGPMALVPIHSHSCLPLDSPGVLMGEPGAGLQGYEQDRGGGILKPDLTLS